ncbi:MAG TPA: MalY/PatB family protein [Erysipelotrichaceae bacterium]|nr:MalY/PatB family protein [Erysipelotrichaceae bacterium]HQB31796.1 MalY/PatB family protein [Erysipelotrichaceae bacterium]
MYNFDKIVNRKNTNCYKWDSLKTKYPGVEDIIPMGIADMDFEVCDEIEKAFKERIKHPVYGYYYDINSDLAPIIYERYKNKGYDIELDDIVVGTGVVYIINHIIRTFTEIGDKIVLPAPYYTPFGAVIENNDRIILPCEMKLVDGVYKTDLSSIEDQIDQSTSMFIFCNPHNPTGRVFDNDEMLEVADFCQRHNLLIISDEIHSDFALTKPFYPLININEFAKYNTFTVSSCTKTFNIAGIKVAFCMISNPELREKYIKYAKHSGLGDVNSFGIEAIKAAYLKGQRWEEEMLEYIRGNRAYVLDFFKKNLPDIKVNPSEGTYLLWIDFTGSGKDINDIQKILINDCKVELNDGLAYGGYSGFARMNLALPRCRLIEACNRIYSVFK